MKYLTPNKQDVLLAIFFLFLSIATVTDLLFENVSEQNLSHLIIEGSIFLASVVFFGYTFRRIRESSIAVTTARQQLAEKNDEAAAWKKRAELFLRGLSQEIRIQFDQWRLTKTECEIALLLIKGFSHQEIAGLKGRSERTVRQHAGAIYQKSGLSGRAELAAFFLEDLLSPQLGE